MTELPGVKEDGMSGRNVQRKLGTTRGSPRRSRTAKALRISRFTVKSRCACEWGGWGRVSDDGSGHYNPNPSEGPWGGGSPILHGSALSSPRPDTARDYRSDHEVHEGRRQTDRRSAHAGSRLKLIDAPGRSRLIRQPSSRTGENPPYGMIGEIEETSASFEARSAPRSYPTAGARGNSRPYRDHAYSADGHDPPRHGGTGNGGTGWGAERGTDDNCAAGSGGARGGIGTARG
jgi:hypothetical protein